MRQDVVDNMEIVDYFFFGICADINNRATYVVFSYACDLHSFMQCVHIIYQVLCNSARRNTTGHDNMTLEIWKTIEFVRACHSMLS